MPIITRKAEGTHPPSLPRTTLLEIARQFGFSGNIRFKSMRGGAGIFSVSISWFRSKGKRYLIKKLKYAKSESFALYCLDFMRHLADNGIPIPCIKKAGSAGTHPQDFLAIVDGEYFTLDRFVPGLDIHTKQAPPHVFTNVGEFIAQIHALARIFRTSYARDADAHTFTLMFDTIKRSDFSRLGTEDRRYIFALIKDLSKYSWQDAPEMHILSDGNLGNMKFDATGRPIALFDWDAPRFGFRFEEILPTTTQTGREGEGFNLHDHLVSSAIEPFIRGYNSKARELGQAPFSKAEIELLPFAHLVLFLFRLSDSRNDPQICLAIVRRAQKIFTGDEWQAYLRSYSA
ncbi:phosphotransferase enzyme family protein [Candidatus Margulisiibacteriota bacterium]